MECWCNGACPNIKLPRALLAQKKIRQAEARLRRILIDAPKCVEANIALGTLLSQSQRAPFALEHFARARALRGATPELVSKIGWTQRQATDVPGARETFKELVQIDGNNPHAWAALISVYEAEGDLDHAEEAIAIARTKFPLAGDLRRSAAIVIGARKRYSEAIALLQDNPSPTELLDRGRFKEKIGDFAGAWSDWMTAKETLRRNGHVYRAERMQQNVARLREIARPERQKWIGRADRCPRPAPIFVCGFPRSGTTMVEAALSAHSRIAAGDEMMFLSECIGLLPQLTRAGVPYPAALMATTAAENRDGVALNVLQKFYLEKARAKIGNHKPDIAYFTDKMCLNELHLPFILALFPGAYIRRVHRHPLDVMVSCMSHMLAHGGFFASSLEACAQHYALADDLLAYYKANLPAAAAVFADVRYEEFVTDHRSVIDRILPGGLAPEQACYDFHLNPWHSRTISYRQVHEPVHDSSVGRWRNYRQQLEPAAAILRHVIERHGYSSGL